MSTSVTSRRSVPKRPVPRRAAPSRTDTKRAPAWALSILFIGAFFYIGVFAIALGDSNTELIHGLALMPIFVGLTVPIALYVARKDRDPTLIGIVMAGIVAKLMAGLLRFFVSFEVYKTSDAAQYSDAATAISRDLRRGAFDAVSIATTSGTYFIKVVSGIVYAVAGVSRVGGFVVFSWLSFVGLVLLARAFKLAIPVGDSRRYLILVLFLPSLVYWPAAMGKEAWMMLTIGMCAYGFAGILRGRATAILVLGFGLLGAVAVRPHVAMMIFVGIGCAFLARRTNAKTFLMPMMWIIALAAMVAVGGFLAGQTANFVDKELKNSGSDTAGSGLSAQAISETLSTTETQTADGGSEFTPITVSSPLDMIPAFVTVFFRPFPFEASNAQSLLSAGECLLLLALIAWSWKRVRSTPRLFRSYPYLAFCAGYLLVFVFAFSSFSNFGILARQRVQALPFLLVFLALPEITSLGRKPGREWMTSPSHSRPRKGQPRNRRRALAAARASEDEEILTPGHDAVVPEPSVPEPREPEPREPEPREPDGVSDGTTLEPRRGVEPRRGSGGRHRA